jgi:alpha-ketoglutarate-dependent taurine dioxygenase
MTALRRRLSRTTEDGVTVELKKLGRTAFYQIVPDDPRDLWTWLEAHREKVAQLVKAEGAVVLRGFDAPVSGFSQVHASLGIVPHGYIDAHTPRTKLNETVFTSTEYPASEIIELHSEMSFASTWPATVMFFCEISPNTDGETPFADNGEILRLLTRDVGMAFREKGVLYTRVFVPGIGLSWQEAFGVSTPGELEDKLPSLDVKLAWRGPVLRVSSKRPATLRHPTTDEEVWFNQALAFHPSALSPTIRRALAELDPADYPNQVCFGDGTPIPDAVIAEVRDACRQVEAVQRWDQGDLVILDNISTSHGRRSFEGPRRILAALGSSMISG